MNEFSESEIADATGQDLMVVHKEMSGAEWANHLAEVARHAPAIRRATETIMATQTYPSDWKQFGEKMALGSAGAERIATLFPIKLSEFKCLGRQDFEDDEGKGYRYVYECKGQLNERQIYATGTYSTRDAFLGKSRGQWKDLHDINQNDIQMAAYRRCQGNAIKALVGIRNLPVSEFDRIMGTTGQDPAAAGSAVPFNEGGKGGAIKGDDDRRRSLVAFIQQATEAGCLFVTQDQGKTVSCMSEEAVLTSPPEQCWKWSLSAVSSFWSKKDEKMVKGVESTADLKGKRLTISLDRAKTAWEKYSG